MIEGPPGEDHPFRPTVEAGDLPAPSAEIDFRGPVFFHWNDGNFSALRNDLRRRVGAEIVDRAERNNEPVSLALGGLLPELRGSQQPVDPDRIRIVQQLQQGNPSFVPIANPSDYPSLSGVADALPGYRAGMILRPFSASWGHIKVDTLTAVQAPEGQWLRLLSPGPDLAALPDAAERLSKVAPPSSLVETPGGGHLLLTEYLQNAQQPDHISQAQLDSWLTRYEDAELAFGADVAPGEAGGLDNFVLDAEQALRWVDGDIVYTRASDSVEELGDLLAYQRWVLGTYLE